MFRCNVNIVIPDDSAAFDMGGFEKRRILELFIDGLFSNGFASKSLFVLSANVTVRVKSSLAVTEVTTHFGISIFLIL